MLCVDAGVPLLLLLPGAHHHGVHHPGHRRRRQHRLSRGLIPPSRDQYRRFYRRRRDTRHDGHGRGHQLLITAGQIGGHHDLAHGHRGAGRQFVPGLPRHALQDRPRQVTQPGKQIIITAIFFLNNLLNIVLLHRPYNSIRSLYQGTRYRFNHILSMVFGEDRN